MIALKEKKITIFGLGQSGLAAAKKLISLGATVLVTEERNRDDIDNGNLAEIQNLGISLECGGHTLASIENSELIVMSPGIHLDLAVLKEAKKRGIPIISEIELAYNLIGKPIIAVTGTNGKTTTVTLISKILESAGKRVAAAGNIGNPLISVDDKNLDVVVVETSSYQLEGTLEFKPWISILLNITEDHLERHENMEEYAKAKSRIFANQKNSDFTIYNIEDCHILSIVKNAKSKLVPFSLERELDCGLFLKKDFITARLGGKEIPILRKEDIKIQGKHNLENVLASSAAALIAGARAITIKECLRLFRGLEHRIEHVKTLFGVEFYNDSKSTNPDSAIAALRTLKQNIILIAGGKDKGTDISPLCNEICKTAKTIILLGEAKERFSKALIEHGFRNIHSVLNMEEAVTLAFNIAKKGDKVLLSPACSSFDMFKNFEERGEVFKNAVLALEKKLKGE